MKFSEFSYSRFTEALLVLIIVGFCVFALHAIHHGDKEFSVAMLDNVKLTLGALLAMVTASRVGRQHDDHKRDSEDAPWWASYSWTKNKPGGGR